MERRALTISTTAHSGKKLIYVVIILAVLVVLSFGLIIFLLTNTRSANTGSDAAEVISGGRGTVLTEDNIAEMQQKAEEDTVQDGYYTTSMSIDWHFDGTVSKDAYVANALENTRTVYFDLFLKDSGEMIYSSPYIPVGAELKGLTLDKELESGTYDTILVYHLVDDEENELSTLSIELTIYVN